MASSTLNPSALNSSTAASASFLMASAWAFVPTTPITYEILICPAGMVRLVLSSRVLMLMGTGLRLMMVASFGSHMFASMGASRFRLHMEPSLFVRSDVE